jgi:hypothetical protein
MDYFHPVIDDFILIFTVVTWCKYMYSKLTHLINSYKIGTRKTTLEELSIAQMSKSKSPDNEVAWLVVHKACVACSTCGMRHILHLAHVACLA